MTDDASPGSTHTTRLDYRALRLACPSLRGYRPGYSSYSMNKRYDSRTALNNCQYWDTRSRNSVPSRTRTHRIRSLSNTQ